MTVPDTALARAGPRQPAGRRRAVRARRRPQATGAMPASSPTCSQALGYVSAEQVEAAVAESSIGRPLAGAHPPRPGRHRRPATRSGDRRALRARPRRPHRISGRHGRRQPALDLLGASLPGRADRLCRSADPARRDGRPRQRACRRRHQDGHRARNASWSSPTRPTSKPCSARSTPCRARSARRWAMSKSPPRKTPRNRRKRLHARSGDAPVVKLVYSILGQAVNEGVSDIHFEPEQADMRVRFPVDGVLHEAAHVPRRMVSAVISRIKIMSELDIAERRIPQDGRVGVTVNDSRVDLRVTTLPTHRGEGATIRILDTRNAMRSLDELGMTSDSADPVRARRAPPLRRRPGHRADRLGQVDDPLCGARRIELGREEGDHDRGPGRVSDRRDQPDQRQPESGSRPSPPGLRSSCAPTPT